MKTKYQVTSTVEVSCKTIVEAESEDEALDLAGERDLQATPAAMGGNSTKEWVVASFDGMVSTDDMEVEEA